MRVLALKSSFVLVGWINILAELTQSGRVYTDVETDNGIVHFLSSTLKECSEEEGIAADENSDPVVVRIERIKREQLNCLIPFDCQTMDHIGALIGAYLDLSTENYRRSIYQMSQTTTPFAFFVMTTKRLLDDVNVLKKGRDKSGNTRKRSRARDINEELEGESGAPNDDSTRRQSAVSRNLSYSSSSSPSAESQSSSAGSSFSSAFPSDPDASTCTAQSPTRTSSKERSDAIRKNEKKPLGGLFSAGRVLDIERGESEPWPRYWPEEKESSFLRMKLDLDVNEINAGVKEVENDEDRRLSHLEKDQSPINTSHETTFTYGNTESSHLTGTTGGSSSSSSVIAAEAPP